ADRSRDDALQARNESGAMFDFLRSTVLAAGPGALGREVTLRAAIDRAVATLDQTFADQPLVGARMRMVIAEMDDGIGAYKAGKRQWTRALRYLRDRTDKDDSDIVRCMQGLANNLQKLQQYSQAEPLFQEALERARRHHDDAVAQSVPAVMNNMGQ